jgi:hypothetical protein
MNGSSWRFARSRCWNSSSGGLFKASDRDRPKKLKLVKSDRTGLERENLLGDPYDYDDLNDRDDWNVRPDYKNWPLDQVVAGFARHWALKRPPTIPSRRR